MDEADTRRQIDQMISFIINEAKDKASEIELKAYEDFNMEKLRTLQTVKAQIAVEIGNKFQKYEISKAVDTSKAHTSNRLMVLSTTYQKFRDIYTAVREGLTAFDGDPIRYQRLCTDLVVESMLQCKEHRVVVQVRRSDRGILEEMPEAAAAKYTQIMTSIGIRGIVPEIKFSLDYLREWDSVSATGTVGGVIVSDSTGTIKCDNTLNTRLDLCFDSSLPELRSSLLK